MYTLKKSFYNISILIPTRKRPKNIIRIINSIKKTIYSFKKTEILFYIDDDDIESIHLLKKYHLKHPNIGCLVGERILMSNYWNELYKISNGKIIMECGDDIIFRTKNWDLLVLEEFEKHKDNILFLYGNDLINGEKIGTHGFVHKDWVEIIGYFVPPYFSCDYIDAWLTDLGRRIKRIKYLPNLITEHMHPGVGKAQWDITHRERRKRGREDNVEQIYNSKEQQRIDDANKLLNYIKGYLINNV